MGVIANALTAVATRIRLNSATDPARRGIVHRLFKRLRRHPNAQTRLALVERIVLSPRQSVALAEVDGQRFLIATAQEGPPSFCLLDHSSPSTRWTHDDEIPFEGTIA